jgi:hypothetical protein
MGLFFGGLSMVFTSRSKTSFFIKQAILLQALVVALLAPAFKPSNVTASGLGDLIQIGTAFLTHMTIHESGHYIMGYMGGAEDVRLDFFTKKSGNLYLGASTAKGLNRESSFPYKIAGEAAALRSYRRQPTTFNRAALFFSGTDFFWYSLYAFYIDGNRNKNYDPVGISLETGLSPEAILGVATFQTALNAYRFYTGRDDIVPYFSLNDRWAEFGVQVQF